MFKRNLVTSTDSYKISHPHQFPEGATRASLYIEARGGDFDEIMVSGLHYISRVIENGITVTDVERANMLFKSHFGRDLFVYDKWMKIATEFGGKLPIDIFGAEEGTVVPVKNAVAVVENTHDDYVWLPGHLETFLLRGVWYPSTVATISFTSKVQIAKYLKETSDLKDADFDFVLKTRLHDFGARGVSSEESARLGGLAHLLNFIGTDTVEAMIMAQDLYNLNFDEAIGISIPAREHTTTICYGDNGNLTDEQEDAAFKNSIDNFGTGVYACVMDSKDYKAAVERVAKTMKASILKQGGVFVFRPDSGDMFDNIGFALETLSNEFGYTTNSKGYKVLHPSVRIIQGDGLSTVNDIIDVLAFVRAFGFSTENIAFGMGGGLLQHCDRDTSKWAMKCSAIMIDGVWRKVRKSPKGAEWKTSKAGRLRLICNSVDTGYKTVDILDPLYAKFEHHNEMIQYVKNGRCTFNHDFDLLNETRRNADKEILQRI